MGLNHMNGRVQDAITGRFLSPDPIIQDPSNAQDYNRYAYVNNNPVTNIDPSGFDTCTQNATDYSDCLQEVVVTAAPLVPGTDEITIFAPPEVTPVSGPLTNLLMPSGNGPSGGGLGSPQTNQPTTCQASGGGLMSRVGSTMANIGQTLSNYGNSTAQVGADLALVSAVSSAVGVPAEPGIVVGGGMAAVGGVMSLVGSVAQYAGGLMSSNSSQAGAGFLSGAQGLMEGALFAATARFGLPGLPSGIPDPLDNMVNAGSAGPGSPTCH